MNEMMKAALLTRHDASLADPIVEIREVERPQPEPGGVLVQVGAAGVCRTDLHIASGLSIGGSTPPLPHILGHENAGDVVAVGDGVDSTWIGSRVLCYPFRTSGDSTRERYGQESLTDERERITPGITAPGGFAEFFVTSPRSLIKLPDDADLARYAPLSDAGLTAYRACRRTLSHVSPGETVLVIGAGGVGHLVVQILLAIGGVEVLVVEPRAASRDFVLLLGAKDASTPEDAGRMLAACAEGGVAAVIDVVGDDASAELGIGSLRPSGTLTCIGIGGDIRLPTAQLVEREIRIQGSFTGSFTDLLEVSRLADLGVVVPEIVTYDLDDAPAALADLRSGEILGRAVLIPGASVSRMR